jgi:hypothetical protein
MMMKAKPSDVSIYHDSRVELAKYEKLFKKFDEVKVAIIEAAKHGDITCSYR